MCACRLVTLTPAVWSHQLEAAFGRFQLASRPLPFGRMHSCNAPLQCILAMHSCNALLQCALAMHSCNALLQCTLFWMLRNGGQLAQKSTKKTKRPGNKGTNQPRFPRAVYSIAFARRPVFRGIAPGRSRAAPGPPPGSSRTKSPLVRRTNPHSSRTKPPLVR